MLERNARRRAGNIMGEIKQAVMIASAGGKQLGQLTRDRPKAMLPVLGKPIFIRILDQMHQAGIRHFIVVMGEQEGAVASYLNMHWLPDVQVQIVLQPFPRGAADALACASSYVTGPFLLASSENLVPPAHVASLIQRQQETDADLVLSVVSTPEDAESEAEAMPRVTIDRGRVTAIGVDDEGSAAHNGETASSFLMCACGLRLLNHLGSTARA